ncbi:MAG: PH domain-containing protein [Alphaproteobacteria bacterium]|nr:PH domain-containing protein [Alphaproteobacteria bacterium]
MSYVNSVLQPGETIKAIGKLHWIIFIRAFVLLVAGIVLLIYASSMTTQLGFALRMVGWAVLALALLAALQAWFMQSITELAITDRRVIYKRGFLSRRTIEMNMAKVETVDVQQSIFGRLLGFGTIRVRGTGQGIENLTGVAAPIALRNAITAR